MSRVVTSLVIVTGVLLGIGCSTTQKIIKNGDPYMIYDEAMKYYNAEEWNKALTLFEAADPSFVGSSREDSLVFYMARCNFKTQDYSTAVELLDNFRRTYGRSGFLEDAEGMYTLSHYYMSPPTDRDQKLTEQAIRVIDEFHSRYPNSEQYQLFTDLRKELVNKLQYKEYNNAYIYFKIEKYKSAIMAFRNALKKYPDSDLREDIVFYITASSYELAHNSVLSKKEDRYLAMIDSYYTFIAEFPNSEYRKDADDMLRKAQKYIKLAERKRSGEEIDNKVLENN